MAKHTTAPRKQSQSKAAIPLIRDFSTTINPDAAAVVRQVAEAMTVRFAAARAGQPPFGDDTILDEALSKGLHLLALEYLGNPGAWSAQSLVSDPQRDTESEPWPARIESNLSQLNRRVAALEADEAQS